MAKKQVNNDLFIFNGFGIKPTNTFISAGTDYYIPNIDSTNGDLVNVVEAAFQKSYGLTIDELNDIKTFICEALTNNDKYHDNATEIIGKNLHNILHLYLALRSYELECVREDNGDINSYFIEDVYYFVENYLRFDKNDTPGILVNTLDHLFINSGIKVALHKNDAGLYVNKSGMGNRGWDVRAQLVDEDYGGYVHLSCAFTMNTKKEKPRLIFCGDKITQMMIVEVKHYNNVEVDEETYNKLMASSERGDAAFGSSDVKH